MKRRIKVIYRGKGQKPVSYPSLNQRILKVLNYRFYTLPSIYI